MGRIPDNPELEAKLLLLYAAIARKYLINDRKHFCEAGDHIPRNPLKGKDI